LAGVAEVAVGEAIEEAETSEAVKPSRDSSYANGSYRLGEPERWNLDRKIVERKYAGIRAGERYRQIGKAAAQQAVAFVQDKFKRVRLRTGARVGK
jgi:hypothetical protein